MEHVHGADKAFEFASEDVIGKMPENVITNILDRLPTQDAVRTSILSKNWRFKWNLVTQLVFDHELSEYGKNITRILLHVTGPITKFVLRIPENIVLDVEDIDHWVLFLSRKGIKELSIINMSIIPLMLPTHIFYLRELKHLRLEKCNLHSPPADCGFPNILSLDLCDVTFGSGGSWKLITRCPLVEILNFGYFQIEKVKLAEIAILKNLKVLSLPFHKLGNIVITSSDIIALGGSLPKLEDLFLDFQDCRFIGETGSRKWVSTAFPCLKILTIFPIDFSSGAMLSCAFEMIWGSPNLKTLNIRGTYKEGVAPPDLCLSEIDYHKMEKLQLRLQNVYYVHFGGSKYEEYLMKCVLACSPLLKKLDIYPDSSQRFDGENRKLYTTKLLKFHRASLAAKINLHKF